MQQARLGQAQTPGCGKLGPTLDPVFWRVSVAARRALSVRSRLGDFSHVLAASLGRAERGGLTAGHHWLRGSGPDGLRRHRRAQAVDRRARADAYAGAPWTPSYFKQLADAQVVEWSSYVYWHERPF